MKKLFTATVVLLLTAFNYSTAQTTVSSTAGTKGAVSKTEQELMKITHELTDAENRGDKKVFDKYFADNYFSTTMDGRIFTKAQILENLTPTPASNRSRIDFEDIQVRENGNTALLSLKFNDHSESNGQKLTQSFQATDVFMKQGGQWKLLTRHLSIIPVDKTVARVDPAIYDAYVGQYEITTDEILTLTREGDKLMGEFTGSKTKMELLPENETTFFEKGRRRQTVFVKDEKGQVSHIIHRLSDGQEVKLKKIK